VKAIRIGYIVALAVIVVSCVTGLIIYAQQLPAQRVACWDPNPASDAVIRYTLTVNKAPLDVLPTSTPAACGGQIGTVFQINEAGALVVSITATNEWGTSPATTRNLEVRVPTAPGGFNVK
jgi:hypothetical protein